MITSSWRAATVVGLLLTIGACSDSDDGSDVAAVSPEPAVSSTPDSLPGRLLFSRFDESSHTFLSTHTISPDGTAEAELTMPGPEGGGRWSRSGTDIAVMTVMPDERIGTAVITADGTVERVLDIPDKTLNLVCTVWSPDDSHLACEGWDETMPERGGIYTVRSSDGGDLARLTSPSPSKNDRPGDYAPDGSRLLFTRGTGEEGRTLMAVDLADGTAARLTTQPVDDPGRYSPDGNTILTSSRCRLLLLTSTGQPLSEVVNKNGACLFGAVWSPDGSRIAFSGGTVGPFADIFTSLPDGSDQRPVTATPDNEIVVEWGPDDS